MKTRIKAFPKEISAFDSSRGGQSTKIDAVVDVHGNPVHVLPFTGDTHDSVVAEDLLLKIKEYCRVEIRFDKLAHRFLGFVHLDCIRILLD